MTCQIKGRVNYIKLERTKSDDNSKDSSNKEVVKIIGTSNFTLQLDGKDGKCNKNIIYL